jgi:hypothetical protein
MRERSYFLLRKLSDELRGELEVDAQERGIPLAEVIRSALCEHYELECSPVTGRKRQDAWEGSGTILLRLQSELFRAIRDDAEESGQFMRGIIIEALEARYVTERAA